jgi:hypothetical protein
MKDEELQREEIEASHTLGGPGEVTLSAKDFLIFYFVCLPCFPTIITCFICCPRRHRHRDSPSVLYPAGRSTRPLAASLLLLQYPTLSFCPVMGVTSVECIAVGLRGCRACILP